LLYQGEPVVGVIHLPLLRETMYAARGHGCWWREGRGEPVRARVGGVRALRDAVVMGPSGLGSVPPRRREEEFRRLLPLLSAAAKVRFGGDCLQHVLVCRGVAHVAVDPVVHAWDVAALVPCVLEAGGVVATREGRRDDVVFAGSLVSCCTEDLLRDVLHVVRYPMSDVRGDPPADSHRTADI